MTFSTMSQICDLVKFVAQIRLSIKIIWRNSPREYQLYILCTGVCWSRGILAIRNQTRVEIGGVSHNLNRSVVCYVYQWVVCISPLKDKMKRWLSQELFFLIQTEANGCQFDFFCACILAWAWLINLRFFFFTYKFITLGVIIHLISLYFFYLGG